MCLNYLFFVLQLVTLVLCWDYFTRLDKLHVGNLLDGDPVYNEYVFGTCGRKGLVFFTEVNLESSLVKGKSIIRGWLNVTTVPTCIILVSKSSQYDMVRTPAYRCLICVPRITFSDHKRRYHSYYFEWYLPPDLGSSMDWNIYFYGIPNEDWTIP